MPRICVCERSARCRCFWLWNRHGDGLRMRKPDQGGKPARYGTTIHTSPRTPPRSLTRSNGDLKRLPFCPTRGISMPRRARFLGTIDHAEITNPQGRMGLSLDPYGFSGPREQALPYCPIRACCGSRCFEHEFNGPCSRSVPGPSNQGPRASTLGEHDVTRATKAPSWSTPLKPSSPRCARLGCRSFLYKHRGHEAPLRRFIFNPHPKPITGGARVLRKDALAAPRCRSFRPTVQEPCRLRDHRGGGDLAGALSVRSVSSPKACAGRSIAASASRMAAGVGPRLWRP